MDRLNLLTRQLVIYPVNLLFTSLILGIVPPGGMGVEGAGLVDGVGGKAPEAYATLALKSSQKSFSMYFLVKDDENANFDNFVAWKYPIFLHFSILWNLLGQLSLPPPPLCAA